MPRPPLDLLPSEDPGDDIQVKARGALGQGINVALDVLGAWQPEQPDFASRSAFQLVGQVLQLMATGHRLLAPGERTFAYAPGASLCLRGLADIHARQLEIWSDESPEQRTRDLLADSLRQEQMALAAAERAGVQVSELRERLEGLEAAMGTPQGVAMANILEQFGEWEILAVYRWESGHVHMGAAGLAASGRTIQSEGAEFDVAMWPVSLWRVGQLTWGLYGVGLRILSHVCSRIGLDAAGLWEADKRLRPLARAAALQIRSKGEPPSLQYGLFTFPLWTDERDEGAPSHA